MAEKFFVIYSEAWYSEHVRIESEDEIIFGKSGGPEIAIRFYNLTLGERSPRLEMFNDSWEFIPEIFDLLLTFSKMKEENCTIRGLATVLKAHGFQDQTPREKPKDMPMPSTREELEDVLLDADEIFREFIVRYVIQDDDRGTDIKDRYQPIKDRVEAIRKLRGIK